MSNHSGSESGNADGEVGLIWNLVVLEYSASIRGVLRCLLSQICEGKKLISLGAGDGTSSKGLLQSIFVLVRDCPLRLLQLMYTSPLDASGHPHVSYGVGNQRVQCSATQTGIPYSVHTMALKGGSMACSQTEIGKLVMWKSLTNNKTVALVLLIQAILVVQASTMNTCPRIVLPSHMSQDLGSLCGDHSTYTTIRPTYLDQPNSWRQSYNLFLVKGPRRS